MKKKSVSLFLLMAMLVLSFAPCIPANAAVTDNDASTVNGWVRSAINSVSEELYADCFIPSKAEAYSGSYSLLSKKNLEENGGQLSGKSIFLRNHTVQGLEAGTYTVSLYAKGEVSNPHMKIYVATEGGEQSVTLQDWHAGQQITKTDAGNGWYKFERTFVTTGTMTQLYFELYELPSDIYIDNVSVVKEGSTQNLIEYGDFEPEEDIIPNGWVRYSGGANSGAYEPYSYILTKGEKYEGSYGVKIKQQSLNNVQLYLANSATNGYEAGEYTISMYIKGTVTSHPHIKVLNGSGEALIDLQYWYAADVGVTRTDAGNGWYRYEKTVNINSAWKNFHLMTYDAPEVLYIDNISVVKKGTTRNILENGDFEPASPNSFAPNTIPYAWERNSSNANAAQLDGSFELTDVISYSGSNSMKVKKQSLSNVQINLVNAFDVAAEAGTYKFTMYVKGEGAPHMNILLDGTDQNSNVQYWYADNIAVTRTDAGNGWYKFEKTYTTRQDMRSLILQMYNANNEFYIDNVSLVKDGSDENLLDNGDFEQVAAKENSYPANTLPKDSGLSANNVSDYKSGGYFSVTDEDAYDGNNSLKLKCSEVMSGKQIYLSNKMQKAEAGEYDITFYLKGSPNPHVNVYLSGNTGSMFNLEAENAQGVRPYRETVGNGWRKYSITQTIGDVSEGLYIMIFSTADVLIDNISVAKSGTDVNLLNNGSFEEIEIQEYSVSEAYLDETGVQYKVDAANYTLDSLDVMLTAAIYILDDNGEKVLYSIVCDDVTLAAGGKDTLSVTMGMDFFPIDEEFYYLDVYVWDSKTLQPYYPKQENEMML